MATGVLPLGTEPPGAGIVRITGRYRLPSDVGSEFKHALAENPQIVILDLNGMSGNSHLLSEVLDPVAPYLAAWPGTVTVVCLADPAGSAHVLPPTITDRVLLTVSAEDGMERARHMVPLQHRTTTFLTPQLEAAEDARVFTRRMLRDWELQDLTWPASVVVSELVTHSIVHAQTVLDLTLSRVDHLVRIAVHDYGSDSVQLTLPRAPLDPMEDPLLDRGLLVVRALTRSWGVFPSRVHGKTVWAVIEAP